MNGRYAIGGRGLEGVALGERLDFCVGARQRAVVGDQPIVLTSQNVPVMNPRGWSPISVRIHSPRAHPFLVAILNPNYANRVPTTKGEGSDYLVLECGHRGLESREGGLRYHPSQGCFRFRKYPAQVDQGIFHPLLRRRDPNSYVARTPWSTNGTTSDSGSPAPTYVEPLAVGWAEGNWTSSADPRVRRLRN